MPKHPSIILFALSLCLSACGGSGGGSGSGGGGTAPAPAPAPTPTPSLPELEFGVRVTRFVELPSTEDYNLQVFFEFDGTSEKPIVPVLQFGEEFFTLVSDVTAEGDGYTFYLSAPGGIDAGVYEEPYVLRLCTSADCEEVYPGSTEEGEIQLHVRVADWATYQGNSAHTGHVPLFYYGENIKPLWTWDQQYYQLGHFGDVPHVASTFGEIFTTGVEFGSSSPTVAIYKLSINGTLWARLSLGRQSYFGAPALSLQHPRYSSVAVQAMDSSSEENPFFITDRSLSNGNVMISRFPSQFSDFLAPTPYGDHYYIATGYYGNEVRAIRADDGTLAWKAIGSAQEVWGTAAPAVDEEYVYYYSGALDVFRRDDGSLVKSIEDPYYEDNGTDYNGAPILGDNGTVYLLSGTYSPFRSRAIVAFDIESGAIRWKSSQKYASQPVLRNDKLYAYRDDGSVDAISAVNGTVLWTWSPPDGAAPFGNLVITSRLLFMSTNEHIYAVSTDGPVREVEFEALLSGFLSISPDHRLLVSQPGKIHAFSLIEDRFGRVPFG